MARAVLWERVYAKNLTKLFIYRWMRLFYHKVLKKLETAMNAYTKTKLDVGIFLYSEQEGTDF